MTYRSVLTYVDNGRTSDDRLASAMGIARQFDAHLTVMAFGYEPSFPFYAYGEPAADMTAEFYAQAKADSEKCLAMAQQELSNSGILADAVPIVCQYGAAPRRFAEHALFSDLVVTSPPYAEEEDDMRDSHFESALLDGDATILVCPTGTETVDPKTAIIAWNGSHEALRATRQALPLLKDAEKVEIVIIESMTRESDPGERLALMLSRHGTSCDILVQPPSMDSISTILQRRSAELGAGLLVMGGYGHSRFREQLIGGVTRDTLRANQIPVLIAH